MTDAEGIPPRRQSGSESESGSRSGTELELVPDRDRFVPTLVAGSSVPDRAGELDDSPDHEVHIRRSGGVEGSTEDDLPPAIGMDRTCVHSTGALRELPVPLDLERAGHPGAPADGLVDGYIESA